MSNEHNTIQLYVGLDEGGCADVGVAKLDGFTLIGNAELEALKDKASKFDLIRSEMQVGSVRTDLPLYRVAHWHGFEVCHDETEIDNALNRAMAEREVAAQK